MNRPLLISVLLASVCVAVLAYSARSEPGPAIPDTWASYARDSNRDSKRLIGMNSADKMLMNQWKGFNETPDRYLFSRSSTFRAPRKTRKLDAFTQFDDYQPDPDRVFTGTFQVVSTSLDELEDAPSISRFPIVVDRSTGSVQIFANKWLGFDEWLPEKQGILQ